MRTNIDGYFVGMGIIAQYNLTSFNQQSGTHVLVIVKGIMITKTQAHQPQDSIHCHSQS